MRPLTFSTPIIDALRPGSSTAEVYLAFLPLLAKLNRLAASVHERGAEFVTADLQNLEKLSWIFTGLLTSLILGSFGLIALTRWNYGMLVATHHEVSDLADDLHVQNARFDAALNNMSQGLCMGTADLTLVVCNDRFRELFGLPELVTPGTSIQELYQVNRRVREGIAGIRPASHGEASQSDSGWFVQNGAARGKRPVVDTDA